MRWAALAAAVLVCEVALGQEVDVPRDAPGGWGDPARTVFLVPGARGLLSGLNAVSFDGLSPASTTFWLDGVPLRLPVHALFGPGALNAAWLSGVHVGAGVQPASRGRSLGRPAELVLRSSPDGGAHGVARLDLLSLGLFAEDTVPASGTRVQAAGRFFGLPALAARLAGVTALLGDWQGRVVQPTGEGELRLLVLGLSDVAALSVLGIPVEARSGGHRADLRWRGAADGGLEAGLTAAHEWVGLSAAGTRTSNRIDGVEQSLDARLVFSRRVSDVTSIELGADASIRRLWLERALVVQIPDVDGTAVPPQVSTETHGLGTAMLGGAWASLRAEGGPWRWTAGLRADVWKPAGASAFVTADPRLTVERAVGERWDVSASAGLLHQPASWLVPVPVLETASLSAGVQEAARAEAVVTWRPADRHRVWMRAYGALLSRTLELSPFDEDFLQTVKLDEDQLARHTGRGWLAGAELAWRLVDTGRWWGQAWYSFQQSRRLARFSRYGDDGLPSGEAQAWVPWTFQQAHALSIAGGWRGGHGWALSFAVMVQSGPPMVGGLFAQQQRPGVDPLRGTPRWVPVDRDQVGTVGPWVRADARASKTWRLAAMEIELFVDVQTLSVVPQPTGTSYGVAPATLEQQARGEVTLTSKNAASPVPGPIPVLGLEIRR